VNQPTLFADANEGESSTALCLAYERCTGSARGRIVYGEPERRGECVNREMRCLTCGRTGTESRRHADKA